MAIEVFNRYEHKFTLTSEQLKPMAYVAYDRLAYFEDGNPDLRISFDTRIRSRRTDLYLGAGDYGKLLLPEEVFDGILKRYTKSYTLKKIKTTDLGSLFELEYIVKMADNTHDKEFIDELRCRNGNLSITLSMASTEPYSIK